MKKIWFEVRRWTIYRGQIHDLEPVHQCSSLEEVEKVLEEESKRDPFGSWRAVRITEEELQVKKGLPNLIGKWELRKDK